VTEGAAASENTATRPSRFRVRHNVILQTRRGPVC